MKRLTVPELCSSAQRFSRLEGRHAEASLYGVTDGKAVGTYLEHKFRTYLMERYTFSPGNSASGVDFPEINVDMKVTSLRQPQSSCPFRSARQKIFGLGYSLLVFVYDKRDESVGRTSTLDIHHTIFVESHRTADYQTTKGIREILGGDGNKEDLLAFMADRMLPLDEIEANEIAEALLRKGDLGQGYLTISNALQWRLQYSRVIETAGSVEGILRVQ